MPITPFHLGPGVLQKSAMPNLTDLRLYTVASVAIDAEPIFKGVTELLGWAQWERLHTVTHSFEGMMLICLAAAILWHQLGLSTRWAALWTAVGVATSHWFLDSLFHGGGDMPEMLGPSLQHYGPVMAEGIAFWCFIFGGAVLLSKHYRTVWAWCRREFRF